MADLTQYAHLLANDAQELDSFLHRFAINVSEFFRDTDRFQTFERDILPRLLAERSRLRLWSAGCSGGHEPYSLAILLSEATPDVSHHILATDIDTVALELARAAGPYAEKEIRNVSPARRASRFRLDDTGRWSGTDQLRAMVTYQRHDLLQDPMPVGFDLIVCRNVLIYFTAEARAQTFTRLAAALRPGGVLFLGATESMEASLALGLRPVSFGFYVREGEGSIQ